MSKSFGVGAVLAALVAAAAVALTTAPAANAQPGLNIPVTCDVAGSPVGCALHLIGFSGQGGVLNAVFLFTNQVTGQVTRVLVPIASQQPGETCTILDLTIQPIDLDLLGLHLHTDTIHLVLTAQRGTLLGDLLCGLFFGSNPLQRLAGLLTGALRNGQIATA